MFTKISGPVNSGKTTAALAIIAARLHKRYMYISPKLEDPTKTIWKRVFGDPKPLEVALTNDAGKVRDLLARAVVGKYDGVVIDSVNGIYFPQGGETPREFMDSLEADYPDLHIVVVLDALRARLAVPLFAEIDGERRQIGVAMVRDNGSVRQVRVDKGVDLVSSQRAFSVGCETVDK